MGGHLCQYVAGQNGLIGALAALLARRRSGRGQQVEIAIMETVLAILEGAISHWSYHQELRGRAGTAATAGWGIYPCKDGFVAAVSGGRDFFRRFADLFEQPALADPRYDSQVGRQKYKDEIEALMLDWLSLHTKQETFERAQALHLPFGYFCTPEDLLRFPHLQERGFFEEVDHPVVGVLPYAGAPYKLSATPYQVRRAPLLGEHSQTACAWPMKTGDSLSPAHVPNGAVHGEGPAGPPLAGIRILDLTMVWAGPYCTQILADLGADVIKVESVKHFDSIRGVVHPPAGARGYPDDDPGPDPWNRTARFNERNRNKFGVTLDLTTPAGIALFKDLVKSCDAVTENFSARVMDKLGLDYATLREIRPDLVMLSMPGFGKSGPASESVAYGITIEMMAGLTSLTGYGDGRPMKGGVNTGDPIAALHAAGALLAALHHRAETGAGQSIDCSQQESAIAVIGDILLDFAMTGIAPEPRGNRDPEKAPQGCYPCRGEDQWLALSVRTEDEWRALCAVIERPDLAEAPRFRTRAARWTCHDELDAIIGAWTAQQDRYQAMHRLQQAGVAAGAVLSNRDLVADPHVRARSAVVLIDHPSVGPREYPAPTARLHETPAQIRRPAPRLGEHNHEVLGDLLGLAPEELQSLEQRQIIGTLPLVER